MTDQFPEEFGKYKIIEEVGRGGFAAVYKAVDTTLDRTVALKVLAPHLLWDPAFVQRFQREARLAANLKHPNVVIIHEFGQEAGTIYIAMEFLVGQTLKEVILEEGALPPARIVNMVGQIASAGNRRPGLPLGGRVAHGQIVQLWEQRRRHHTGGPVFAGRR
jgi:serine/threonine protein kinase